MFTLSYTTAAVGFLIAVVASKLYAAHQRWKYDSILNSAPPPVRKGHAIVVGGAMSGLMAARVCSDYFDRVTIIERDAVPTSDDNYYGGPMRTGVPQSGHGNLLLCNGLKIINRWLPTYGASLQAAGAVVLNLAAVILFHVYGAWRCRVPHAALQREAEANGRTYDPKTAPETVDADGGRPICASRQLYEFTLRKLVLGRAASGGGGCKIELLQRCRVTGLTYAKAPSADGRRIVTGVTYIDLSQASDSDEKCAPVELSGDLVVDASGKLSNNHKWLAGSKSEESKFTANDLTVDHGIAYTSWVLKRTNGARLLPPSIQPDEAIVPAPDQVGTTAGSCVLVMPDLKAGFIRSCFFFPIENNRWTYALCGYTKDWCATPLKAGIEFARGLANPLPAQILSSPEFEVSTFPIAKSDGSSKHVSIDQVLTTHKCSDEKTSDLSAAEVEATPIRTGDGDGDSSAASAAAAPVNGYKYVVPPSRFRGYASIPNADFPKRFLPVGDAYCFVNPVFGAGMSMAAMCNQQMEYRFKEAVARASTQSLLATAADGADVLQSALDRARCDIPSTLEDPWQLAAVEDMSFPGVTTSGISAGVKLQYSLIRKYVTCIHYACSVDYVVFQTFLPVFNMLQRIPDVVTSPAFLARVLYANLFIKHPTAAGAAAASPSTAPAKTA